MTPTPRERVLATLRAWDEAEGLRPAEWSPILVSFLARAIDDAVAEERAACAAVADAQAQRTGGDVYACRGCGGRDGEFAAEAIAEDIRARGGGR